MRVRIVKRMISMNIYIFFVAVVFGLVETSYFGWNFFPSTDAELVCDGIFLLLLTQAFQR